MGGWIYIHTMVLKTCVAKQEPVHCIEGTAPQPPLTSRPGRILRHAKIYTYIRAQCTLGKDGVSKVHGFGSLSAFEQALVDDNVPALIKMAQKGSDFVKSN